MTLNWTHLGIYALFVIIIMGFITTAGAIFANDQEGIVDAQARLQCPLPEFDNTYVDTPSAGQFGVYYACNAVESPPASDNWSISTGSFPRMYNATLFSTIPSGWFQFSGDYLGAVFLKISAVLYFLVTFLTPIEFNVFGFGLSDIGGAGATFVLTIYITCYIFIAVMIYKAVNPLSGGD